MGSIKNLGDGNLNTHILLTNSSLSEMYIYDILKEKCKAGRDSILEVNNRGTFDSMLELINVQPFLADKWFFVVDYSKIKKYVKGNSSIVRVDTSEFLIKVKNYSEYKEVRGLFKSANDIYLSYINFYDVEYLLRDYNISDKLISFVYKSYSSDPEQVFVLLQELKNGNDISTRKQISDICGVSVGSINSFAISLLGGEPKGVRGTKQVIRNRLKVAYELCEVYGVGKFRNFLMASIKDILDIKTLYLNGAIYDRITDLPDVKVKDISGNLVSVYDENRLARYKMYLDTIIDTPYSRIVRLYLMLKKGGRWYRDSDMVSFIYRYYEKGDIL